MLMVLTAGACSGGDLMRFTNGDQLHGSFMGMNDGPGLVWRRDDVGEPVEFKTTEVRHVVLNDGRARKGLGSLAYVGLVNGDRVPGRITAIDGDSVKLETLWGGELRLPRDQVELLAPNPLGGRVYYHGPFVKEGWKMVDGPWQEEAEEEGLEAGEWAFSGSAWYWDGKDGGVAIVRESGMVDRSVLSFDLAWKNRLSVALAFHADFKTVDPEEGKDAGKRRNLVRGEVGSLPYLFGNSYVLQIYSNYLMLYRTSIDEDGRGRLDRVRANNNNFRLNEIGRAHIELRCNRHAGTIALFLDDEFVAQWNEGEGMLQERMEYAGKGDGFGFVVQGDDAPVRVSDVIVSEWNGMPDSARSLQVEEYDVVLMANGTDRYAGTVGGLDEDGRVVFEGRHGKFRFPLDDVAEIRFAGNGLAERSDEAVGEMKVRLSPLGVITGKPLGGDAGSLHLASAVFGEVAVDLGYAVMLDLALTNNIGDDWDVSF